VPRWLPTRRGPRSSVSYSARLGSSTLNPPWGGPDQVWKYLSRYTHRVAIATQRLVFVGDGVVRFRYKDYRAGGATKSMELRAQAFLRRFLLHVVPPGVVRIGHFGLLATRARTNKLARCRPLLAVVAAAVTSALPTPTRETPAAGTETTAPARCPACGGGSLRIIAVVAPQRGIPP
jgi:Putative transposase